MTKNKEKNASRKQFLIESKRKQTNIIILHILNSLTGRIHQPTHLHPLPHYRASNSTSGNKLIRVCMWKTLTGFPLLMLLLMKYTMSLTVYVLVLKFWRLSCLQFTCYSVIHRGEIFVDKYIISKT